MKSEMKCPVCGEGLLQPRKQIEAIEYRGQQIDIEDFFHECEVCGTESALPKDIRDGVRSSRRAKKTHDGMLLGGEIQAILDHYKITQAQAAQIFGGGPVAFSKYKNDDVCHSDSMDKLLRLAMESSDAFYKLADMSKVQLTKPMHSLKVSYTAHMSSSRNTHAHWLEEIDAKVAFGKFSTSHLENTCCNDKDFADAA